MLHSSNTYDNRPKRLIASLRLALTVVIVCLSFRSAIAQNASALVDIMSAAGYQEYQAILSLHDAGELDQAQARSVSLLEDARARLHPIDEAAAQRLIGLVAIQRHQYDLASQAFEQALVQFEIAEEFILLATLNADLGTNLRLQGKHAKALSRYYNALSLFESFEDSEGIAEQKSNIGVVLEKMGQYEEALTAFSQALDVQRQHNDTRGIEHTLHTMGEIYRDLEQTDRALMYFQDSLAIAKQLGVQTRIAHGYLKVGEVLTEQGRHEEAIENLNNAIMRFEKLNATRDLDAARVVIGSAMIGSGNIDEGIQLIAEVLWRAQQRENAILVTQARYALARGRHRQSEYDLALAQSELGLLEAIERAEKKQQIDFYSLRAEIFADMGDFERAYRAITQQKRIETMILMQRRDGALTNLQSEIEYVRQEQNLTLLRQNKMDELSLAEQRNSRNVTLLASLIILLLLGFLLFSRHSQKLLNQQLAGLVKRRTHELERKNEELQSAYRTLEHMSLRDSLTGCYNRHFLDANLPAEIKRCIFNYRSAQELGKVPPVQNDLLCFIVDIDDFKVVNDSYGHVAGDKLLVQFAEIIGQVFRHSDLQIRWGGEEFLIICRNTPRDEGPLLAERLREAIDSAPFKTQTGISIHVTCSIGLAAFPLDLQQPERISWEQTFTIADHCLYSAKSSGKNCWVGVSTATEIEQRDELMDVEQELGLGRLNIVTSLNHISNIVWHDIKPDAAP